MLKFCRVTKVKMLFLVMVYVFNFNLFEFSAAILEKGLLKILRVNHNTAAPTQESRNYHPIHFLSEIEANSKKHLYFKRKRINNLINYNERILALK